MTQRRPIHGPEAKLEIGRRYELGLQNRSKALCTEFNITAHMLLNCAAAYREAAKGIRATAEGAMGTASAETPA